MTTIAIVEDDVEFRSTLAECLDETPEYRCICLCGDAEEALRNIPAVQPEIVLMDINLPRMSGVECTRQLKKICPSAQVLVLTVYEDCEHIFDALKAGAVGYLLKRSDPVNILLAIQEVKQGGAPMSSQIARRVVQSFLEDSLNVGQQDGLSAREYEILQQLSKGYSSKEIAGRLAISYQTVKVHLKHIYEKLHVRSRTEALIKFMDNNPSPPSSRRTSRL
jgi:DNA-binding NarL/FixJ family response regulator